MGGNEMSYIQAAFDANYIAPLGANLTRFEEMIREHVKTPNALAVVSGTAALHLALRVLGVGAGDVVLASDLTFIGSVTPILYQNATPLFIDSEEKSWNLSPELLERELEERQKLGKPMPKALILTHLYGQMARMEAIAEVCDKYGVILIEDAAEALGASWSGKQAGTFGRMGAFSFNGNKILTTSGGGMLVGPDAKEIDKARFYATQAREPEIYYQHEEYGYNYRMSNIVAGIGCGQMEVLEERVNKRRQIFDWYKEALDGIKGIGFMPEPPESRGNRWLTVITIDPSTGITPEQVRLALEEENIESRPLWKPMSMQPLFTGAEKRVDGTGERLFATGLCLPSGTAMEKPDVERVATLIRKRLA